MKKLFYTLSLLCFFVTSSFAQDANAVEPQELTKKEKRQLKKETKKSTQPLFINYRMNAGYKDPNNIIFDEGGRIIGEACHIIDLMSFIV